jgi:hypothetical protein
VALYHGAKARGNDKQQATSGLWEYAAAGENSESAFSTFKNPLPQYRY